MRGLSGRRRRRRPRGAGAVPRRAPRPRPAGPHAARAVRRRGQPDHPRRVRRADHHAHREGRRGRQGRRAGAGRRRLRHEAVLACASSPPASGRSSAAPSSAAARASAGRTSTWARVQLDLAGHRLLRDGVELPLKPKAFELLAFLVRHPGQVFTRDQLLEHVWGYDYAGETRTVDVHVHWLRGALEEDPAAPDAPPHGARRGLRPAPAPDGDRRDLRPCGHDATKPSACPTTSTTTCSRTVSASRRSSPGCARRPRPMPMAQMQIAPGAGRASWLARGAAGRPAARWRSGTFTGYSSLAVALAMPDDGRIVCLDVSEEYTIVARRYWAEAGVADQVDLRLGPGDGLAGGAQAEGRDGHVRLRLPRRRQGALPGLLRGILRARSGPAGCVAHRQRAWPAARSSTGDHPARARSRRSSASTTGSSATSGSARCCCPSPTA